MLYIPFFKILLGRITIGLLRRSMILLFSDNASFCVCTNVRSIFRNSVIKDPMKTLFHLSLHIILDIALLIAKKSCTQIFEISVFTFPFFPFK